MNAREFLIGKGYNPNSKDFDEIVVAFHEHVGSGDLREAYATWNKEVNRDELYCQIEPEEEMEEVYDSGDEEEWIDLESKEEQSERELYEPEYRSSTDLKGEAVSGEQQRKWCREAQQGNKKSRELLILSMLGLIDGQARSEQFRDCGLSTEDLRMFAIEKLNKAIDNYKFDKGAKVSTYAFKYIKGALIDAKNAHGRSIKRPQDQSVITTKVIKVEEALKQKHLTENIPDDLIAEEVFWKGKGHILTEEKKRKDLITIARLRAANEKSESLDLAVRNEEGERRKEIDFQRAKKQVEHSRTMRIEKCMQGAKRFVKENNKDFGLWDYKVLCHMTGLHGYEMSDSSEMDDRIAFTAEKLGISKLKVKRAFDNAIKVMKNIKIECEDTKLYGKLRKRWLKKD